MSHFSTVLIAALEHPDQSFREHLSNKIDHWIRSKKPKHSKQSIEKAILECKGTPIEPFILGKKHFYISLILAMLAFTKEENQRVVRLMSQDTYGVYTGGCLLKDDLSFSYHENFYKGKKPKYEEGNWFSTYRQYCGELTTHGQLGGAFSDDEGESWTTYTNLNSNGNPPWGGGGVGGRRGGWSAGRGSPQRRRGRCSRSSSRQSSRSPRPGPRRAPT